MTVSTTAPIKRALVATMRANGALNSALTGGIHEGFAPKKVPYPLLTYQEITAPYDYDWGGLTLTPRFDVCIFHTSSVDANNIDALVLATLDDAALSVSGQSTLYCRRMTDLSDIDVDDENRKVYMVGGTYEVWTAQPHP